MTSTPDIATWTLVVMVTPAATTPTIKRKKIEPTIVTAVTLFASDVEKSPSVTDPAGKDANTTKSMVDTSSAHPERKPSVGCSARRTHE